MLYYFRCFETFPNGCGLSLELPFSSISNSYPSNCMFVCYVAIVCLFAMLQSHWRHSLTLSNFRILEGDLTWPAGQYSCPFTSSVGSTAFFLSWSLVASLHFFRWRIKICFYSICGKPTAINKGAETLPCKLPVSGDSSTDVVEFPAEDFMFWKSSLFWCLLLVEASA